jgi:hypothetical protein
MGVRVGFGWRNRDISADEGEMVDPALETAGAERLRALRRRAAQVEEPVAPVTVAGPQARPELADNPFALLELPLAAGTAQINEAYDSLSFELGRDEAALSAARAALMAPRERLAAEIRWMPGLPRATTDALIAALRTGDSAPLRSMLGKASGVARFNIAVALLETDLSDAQAAGEVLAAARDVDGDALLEQLDEARFAAREREIDRALFDECLDERARTVGAKAAAAFAASATGRAALTRALQADGAAKGRFDTGLRDALLAGYGAEIGQALDQSRGRILSGIEALKADPASQGHATSLLTALDVWSNLRRPMQVHEAARGLDDPASGDIFASVRSLSVDLSNEHQQYEIALRLGRALLSSFALVPTHRAALERELPTLIGNAAVKRANQLHDMALAALRPLARQVEAGGLEGAGGLAGSINALVADVECLGGRADNNDKALETVFMTVRDIAIEMHNKARERDAAYAMLVWLAGQGPPAPVAQKLEEDLKHFGVEADVAVREAPKDDAAPAAPRAPGSFGRSSRGGGGGSGKAATPPARAPREKSAPTPRAPREKGRFGVARGFLVVIILIAILYGRGSDRAERRRQREAAAASGEAVAPSSGDYYSDRAERRRANAEDLLEKIRAAQERPAQPPPAPRPFTMPPEHEPAPSYAPSGSGGPATSSTPRFVPGQPMVDAQPAGTQP